jgi:ribose 5-phosphate isomerase RpiB
MRNVLGSDHAGFSLKEAVKGFVAAERREFLDLGAYCTDPVDYPDYAEAWGASLAREKRARPRDPAVRENPRAQIFC